MRERYKLSAEQIWALQCAAILTEQPDQQYTPNHEELVFWSTTPQNIETTRKNLAEIHHISDRQSLLKELSSLSKQAETSDKPTKAFKYIGIIHRCRKGCLAGYLTSGEAWDYAMSAAKAIEPGFTSWNDLADCYIQARHAEHHQRPGETDFDRDARRIAAGLSKTTPFRVRL